MAKPKAGLLPMYLELYDRNAPERRGRIEEFVRTIEGRLGAAGVELVTAQVCRLRSEFEAAVKLFEESRVSSIITLHLAYSPSLESVDALCSTGLPVIVLDTTPTYEFGFDQVPGEIAFNHGIHGVMDMCNLLKRRGKFFRVEAGHCEHSDVVDRVAAWARGAATASAMRSARVGRIGESFAGMGDFAVGLDVLRSAVGLQVVQAEPATLRSLVPGPDDDGVVSEVRAYGEEFECQGPDPSVLTASARANIAVRRWMESEGLTAFTMNFLAVDSQLGLPTVPFLEASGAMARGIGYAGEGDVLTAALVGALLSTYPDTTFTEVFCPDWAGDRLFLSHMGEMNLAIAAHRPKLIEKPFPFTDVGNPAVAVARFRSGEAVFVDLAPQEDDRFALILAPVSVVGPTGEDGMASTVHGWIKPRMPIADFLASYSALGGTHHSALVYTEDVRGIAAFGELMGWRVVVLDGAD